MPEYPEMIRIGTVYPPQVFNPAANNGAGGWELLTGADGAYKAQSVQLVVEDSFSGSGNMTKVFDEEMHGLVVSNDHSADLTLTVHGKARTVKAGEVYEGRFKPFGSVVITASGPWRAEAMQQTGVASAVVTPPEEDTTAPDNVTGLDYNAVTQSSVELVWNASVSSDTIAYEVWRGGSLLTTVTGTTYTATGLSASTQYTFTIKAKDAAGNISSGTSINVTTAAQPADTTPPDNVTGLEATDITETGLTLTWLASPSGDLKDYRVYQGATLIATVTGLSRAVTGLTAGTEYTFTIKARDNANNEASGASVTVTTEEEEVPIDTTPPSDVTNLVADPGETSVFLTWTASVSGDVAGYNVYRGDTKLNTSLVTATTYTASGLTEETEYTFRVTAVDTSSNESDGATVTTTTTEASEGGAPVTDGRTLFLENPANNTTVQNPENYFSGTGDWTLAVTAKFAVSGSNAASLLVSRFSLGATDNVINLNFSWDNKIGCVLYGTKADGTTSWTPSVSSGSTTYTDHSQFYHIVVQREGTTLRLFVNDVLLQTTNILTTDIIRTTSALALKIGENGRAATFKNVSYYNRALSSAERTQNYNALK